MGLIQLQIGGINLSSASTAKTTEEDPSGSAEAGSSAFGGAPRAFGCVITRTYMCDNRLKSVELEQLKQQRLLDAAELPRQPKEAEVENIAAS